jgi:hypothetical protein
MNTHLVCNLKVGKLQPIAPILPPRFDGPKDKKPLIKIPTYDDVVAAQKRIAPFAVRTPLVESHALGERVGVCSSRWNCYSVLARSSFAER